MSEEDESAPQDAQVSKPRNRQLPRSPDGVSREVSESMKRIVEISFKFRNPRSTVEKHWLGHAHIFRPRGEIKGLEWKIWLMNRTKKTAGGIYLFRNEASARAYINGPIIAAARTCPECSAYDPDVRVWEILPRQTKITRGPVD